MNVEVLEKTNSKVILQQFVKMLYLEISRQNEDLTYHICSDYRLSSVKGQKKGTLEADRVCNGGNHFAELTKVCFSWNKLFTLRQMKILC